jgi:Domain of unknown function (DUF5753)
VARWFRIFPGLEQAAELIRGYEPHCVPGLLQTAGPHPAMYGTFHVFRFPDRQLPDIVCGENLTSAFYLDEPGDAAACLQALDRISAQAAPAEQTATILRDTRKEIGNAPHP